MDDGEFAELTPEKVTVYDRTGREVGKTVSHVVWDIEAAEKGGYEHFMMKEIMEQPRAVKNTVEPRIRDGKIVFEDFDLTAEQLAGYNKIVITACGSAYHAGVVGKYVIEALCRIPVECELASELRYRNPIIDRAHPANRGFPVRRDGGHHSGHARVHGARREVPRHRQRCRQHYRPPGRQRHLQPTPGRR